MADGRALGDLVTIEEAPFAGANHVTSLAYALKYATDSGFVVKLATWEQLSAGTLPP